MQNHAHKITVYFLFYYVIIMVVYIIFMWVFLATFCTCVPVPNNSLGDNTVLFPLHGHIDKNT